MADQLTPQQENALLRSPIRQPPILLDNTDADMEEFSLTETPGNVPNGPGTSTSDVQDRRKRKTQETSSEREKRKKEERRERRKMEEREETLRQKEKDERRRKHQWKEMTTPRKGKYYSTKQVEVYMLRQLYACREMS